MINWIRASRFLSHCAIYDVLCAIHHKTRQVSPTPLHPRSSCHIFKGDLINDFKLWWIYSIRNISSFRVIEILGWKGNCSRLTQLEVEWESDEYLELDLFSGKKRGCWEEQNKFMFLTSLSTKTQIGTFFSLCFLPTKENVFGKFCNTSPSFPLNINTFCLSPSNAMLDPKKTIAIREGLEGRALSKSWHCSGKEIPTEAEKQENSLFSRDKSMAIRRYFGKEIHLFALEDSAGKTLPGEKLGRGWKNFIIVLLLPLVVLRKTLFQ